MESAVVSLTYLTITFDVDISSLLTKELHHVQFATLGCLTQGS